MDISKFSQNSPGKLVKVSTDWGEDHGFVPDPLPPDWTFPPDLWPLLASAKHEIGILEGLGRNLPNPAIVLRPLADREAIRSSRLEGTYASPKELLLFELEPRESESAQDPTNDHREVFNYRKALQHGMQSELPLSLRLLRELHRILLSGVRGKDKNPGEFRSIQVGIGAGGRFIPPPPENVMECLHPLELYLNAPSSAFDPLVNCFVVHYQFETIHPFNDGNGRVGRLLLALMLQQQCGLTKPWLYLSEFFEKNRDEYVQYLFDVSATGNWYQWIEFCIRGTLEQARETLTRCEQLLRIREQFRQRVADVGGSFRLHQIVDDIFHSPFVRIADLPDRLDVSYPTAKSDVERLENAGILREVPNVYPKTYYAPEVFSIAYEKLDDDLASPSS